MRAWRGVPARWGLFAILVVFVAVNARWIVRYRVGQPYEMDESGYLTYALMDLRGLLSGGLAGWIAEIEAPSYQAPLVTALTSLVFAVTGTEPAWGFATMVLSGAAAIAAAYALAKAAGGPRAALVAALLVACSPAVLNGSRGFNFGLPAAAVMALALLAMARTAGFRRIGWSVAFGVLAGLLPLTRTMTIAFLPGLGLAALVTALRSGTPRRSLGLLLLSGASALATMATWLVPNGRYVAEYLLEFGYGRRAETYGAAVTFDALQQLVTMLRYVEGYVHLPALLVLLLGLACLMLTARGWRAWLDSALLPPGIVAAAGLAALMTSRNKGSAFATPLLVPLIVLAAVGLVRAARPGWRAALAYGAVAVATLVPAISMADLEHRLAWPRTALLPVLGQVTLSDGTGNVQGFEKAAGYASPIPTMPIPKAEGRDWVRALRWTAQRMHRLSGTDSVTALGVRGYLYNSNSINFVWMFDGHPRLLIMQATPEELGDTVEAYERFLTVGNGASSCQLLTASGTTGEVRPAITPGTIAEAARRAGFLPVEGWQLPDARTVTLWQRPRSSVPCPARPSTEDPA